TIRRLAIGSEQVTDLRSHFHQALMIERCQAKLHGPRVVESGIRLEIHMQSLGQWFKTLDSLWAVVEGRGAGDDQVQAGKPATVNVVEQLSQCVQTLLSHIRT